MTEPAAPFPLGERSLRPGTRTELELPIAKTVTGAPLALPVLVLHGRTAGPVMWVNAAIHGDEVNGVEIIRRVSSQIDVRTLRGTVIAVPVVNVPGFVNGDRYLPDRRDLNRSFPGSPRGSLASRIAHIFMTEIVARCTVGIDLHSGSGHRTNLAQVRGDLDNPVVRTLADAFATPVMMHASTRDGSLRQAGNEAGAAVVMFEGGEAWRFDEDSIRIGTAGVLRVLETMDMIESLDDHLVAPRPVVCRSSRWVRARRSGVAQLSVTTGDHVQKNQELGSIHDAFGNRQTRITAPVGGIVVGLNLDPIVNQGDAMIHVAEPEDIS